MASVQNVSVGGLHTRKLGVIFESYRLCQLERHIDLVAFVLLLPKIHMKFGLDRIWAVTYVLNGWYGIVFESIVIVPFGFNILGSYFSEVPWVICSTHFCLHLGPLSYFQRECCVDGKSMAAPHVNLSFSPIHWCNHEESKLQWWKYCRWGFASNIKFWYAGF